MKTYTMLQFLKSRAAVACLLITFGAIKASAQCTLSIINLPDTIKTCSNTQVQLSPSLAYQGTLVALDTIWTPATGLSATHVLNPTVTVGTTSTSYKISVTSITSNNFVDNGDFSNGNTGFSSAYTYASGYNCLQPEGLYAITDDPSYVHTAFAQFGDHTTGTGQMMVVNGASSPVNIWCQDITVTPYTDYDFSAYGASCVTSNPAVLQFNINGNLLGSPLQLPTTTGQWVEFHTVWNSGPNTSITICIYDQQTAANGNDFAIDDITFRQICMASDSVYIAVEDIHSAIDTTVKLGCAQDTVDFTAINNGATTPDNYIWDFGDGTVSTEQNPEHIYTSQGVYTVKLTTSTINGCGDEVTIKVDTRHPLSASFTADKDSICAGQSITFTNTDVGTNPNYFWDFGDGTYDNSGSPTHTYPNAGVYNVVHVVSNDIPCTDTARMQVVVLQTPTIDMTVSPYSICAGNNVSFNATLFPGYNGVTWDFGDNNKVYDKGSLVHAYETEGTYHVTVTASYPSCPDASIGKDIYVTGYPKVDIGHDTSMCPYSPPITLTNAYINPDVKYYWSTGDTTISTLVTHPGTYWLRVTNGNGYACSTIDSIDILNSCYLDIPNAFTPNNDGVNDYFFPRQLLSKQLIHFDMEVYDRWGVLVFKTNSLNGRGWDGAFNGKPQPEGVYIYMIDAQIAGMDEEKIQGNVTLMR